MQQPLLPVRIFVSDYCCAEFSFRYRLLSPAARTVTLCRLLPPVARTVTLYRLLPPVARTVTICRLLPPVARRVTLYRLLSPVARIVTLFRAALSCSQNSKSTGCSLLKPGQ